VAEKKSLALSRNDCQIIQMITQRGSYLVSEPWLFKICLLLILTLPQDSLTVGRVGNDLYSKYLTIFRRRLNWINLNKFHDQMGNEDFGLEKIMEGIQKLKVFSTLTYQVMCEK
jgi:hypothetical protein